MFEHVWTGWTVQRLLNFELLNSWSLGLELWLSTWQPTALFSFQSSRSSHSEIYQEAAHAQTTVHVLCWFAISGEKISMIPMRMPLGGLEVLGSALNSLTKRWFSSMFAHRFAISEERWRDQWSMVDQWYSFQWFPMRMPCGQLFWFWLRSSNCEEDVSCDHVTRASD